MHYQSFLIKYAEIGTKGNNRYMFEDALVHDIRRKLSRAKGEFRVTRERGRIYVTGRDDDFDDDEVIDCLQHVFGVVGICPMIQLENTHDYRAISDKVLEYFGEVYGDRKLTFKCETRRADKGFPMHSSEIDAEIGGDILDHFPNTSVDVHHPDVRLRIEIRQYINIFSEVLPGPGGMPLGSTGKAMLLLSGGIDSPVAGYMISVVARTSKRPTSMRRHTRQSVQSRRSWILPMKSPATRDRLRCMSSISRISSFGSTISVRMRSLRSSCAGI